MDAIVNIGDAMMETVREHKGSKLMLDGEGRFSIVMERGHHAFVSFEYNGQDLLYSVKIKGTLYTQNDPIKLFEMVVEQEEKSSPTKNPLKTDFTKPTKKFTEQNNKTSYNDGFREGNENSLKSYHNGFEEGYKKAMRDLRAFSESKVKYM